MNQTEEQFIDECPTFARDLGITDLRLWRLTNSVVSFDWPVRYDKLDEAEYSFGVITNSEKHLLVKVLQAWDDIES